MSKLKIIFAGTPQFAAHHLSSLLNSRYEVCAVYTQPDRPAGRGKKLKPSAVKTLALEHDIPVMQPQSLKDSQEQEKLAALGADIMVVVAYGLLLPQAVLDTPRLGCINVHGSILPRWRGAAPIQRAIEAGDTYSGVTIMQMDAGLDTGDMLLKRRCEISTSDTSTDLHDRLCEIGPPALLEALDLIAEQKAVAETQNDEESCYAAKIEKSEALIDWKLDSRTLDRKIRAFNPFPVCYSEFKGERLKIYRASGLADRPEGLTPGELYLVDKSLRVACGQGALAIETLQLPGKKPMPAEAFINGFQAQLKEKIVLGAQ